MRFINRKTFIIGLASSCLLITQAVTAAAPKAKIQTLDDQLLSVSEISPEFGGMFYDDNGDLNVYLTNTKAKRSTLAALKKVFGENLLKSAPTQSKHFKGKPRLKSGDIRVLKGRFNIKQLAKWKKNSNHIFLLKEAVYLDLDEAKNRITIGISTLKAKQSVEDILTSQGVPLKAITIIETKPVIAMTHSLRSQHRPTKGGIQIKFSNNGGKSTCTLGFNATRYGVRGFMTNSHCTDTRGGTEGTLYYQSNSTLVGYEYVDPNYSSSAWPWVCPWFKRCRYSDAAFVRYYGGTSSSLGKIARTTGWNNMSLNINTSNPELRIIAERASNITGGYLDKIGRTTGWSYGKVTATCQNINVSNSDIHMKCQDTVYRANTKLSGPGDSGSPVFVWHGNTVTLAGILWGGSSNYSDGTGNNFILSPMRFIESEVGAVTTF